MLDPDAPLCFVDTNLWLYAFIESGDTNKSKSARELIRDAKIAISTQIINEVCYNLLRKAKFTNQQIEQLIESFYAKYQIVELARDVLVDATRLRSKHSFSFWDSLIVAAALRANAQVLYSEDLQDGLIVETRLRIVNPFLHQIHK